MCQDLWCKHDHHLNFPKWLWISVLTNGLKNAFPERRGPNLLNMPRNKYYYKYWASTNLFGSRSCVILIRSKYEQIPPAKPPLPTFILWRMLALRQKRWTPQSWRYVLISDICRSREILNSTHFLDSLWCQCWFRPCWDNIKGFKKMRALHFSFFFCSVI